MAQSSRKSALRSPQIFPELPSIATPPTSHNYTDTDALNDNDTSSVSTAALVAARPRVVNELLFKLVDINSGIERKLKAYEEQIRAYEERIKELEELNKEPEWAAQSIYQPTSLSIPDDEKILLSKWPLIEEKFGLLWSTISLLLLLFLGYTWIDISGLGPNFVDERGWIRNYMVDHGDGGLYVNQMMMTLCFVFDLISIMIWGLRHCKVFVYGDFKELHDTTSILSMVFLGLHFMWFQYRAGWLLLAKSPLFCILTLSTIGIHLFSMFSAKINKIYCFRGDIRYIKTSPTK